MQAEGQEAGLCAEGAEAEELVGAAAEAHREGEADSEATEGPEAAGEEEEEEASVLVGAAAGAGMPTSHDLQEASEAGVHSLCIRCCGAGYHCRILHEGTGLEADILISKEHRLNVLGFLYKESSFHADGRTN